MQPSGPYSVNSIFAYVSSKSLIVEVKWKPPGHTLLTQRLHMSLGMHWCLTLYGPLLSKPWEGSLRKDCGTLSTTWFESFFKNVANLHRYYEGWICMAPLGLDLQHNLKQLSKTSPMSTDFMMDRFVWWVSGASTYNTLNVYIIYMASTNPREYRGASIHNTWN